MTNKPYWTDKEGNLHQGLPTNAVNAEVKKVKEELRYYLRTGKPYVRFKTRGNDYEDSLNDMVKELVDLSQNLLNALDGEQDTKPAASQKEASYWQELINALKQVNKGEIKIYDK